MSLSSPDLSDSLLLASSFASRFSNHPSVLAEDISPKPCLDFPEKRRLPLQNLQYLFGVVQFTIHHRRCITASHVGSWPHRTWSCLWGDRSWLQYFFIHVWTSVVSFQVGTLQAWEKYWKESSWNLIGEGGSTDSHDAWSEAASCLFPESSIRLNSQVKSYLLFCSQLIHCMHILILLNTCREHANTALTSYCKQKPYNDIPVKKKNQPYSWWNFHPAPIDRVVYRIIYNVLAPS